MKIEIDLPGELGALLQMAALDDHRSLNGEIITLLSDALKAYKRTSEEGDGEVQP